MGTLKSYNFGNVEDTYKLFGVWTKPEPLISGSGPNQGPSSTSCALFTFDTGRDTRFLWAHKMAAVANDRPGWWKEEVICFIVVFRSET